MTRFKTSLNRFWISTLRVTDVQSNSIVSLRTVKMEDTGKTRLFIAMGRKDGMTPKKLVEFIIKKAKVKTSETEK